MTLQESALAAHDAGLCVLPAAGDGTKRPGVPSWTGYQKSRPTRDALAGMVEHADGVGAVCGEISGGLVMVELEGRSLELLPAIVDAANRAGLAPLFDRVRLGYTEVTPSGGAHWLVRTTGTAPGNLKLARNAAGEVLAETRGEGGWTIIAPSGGRTHPTGQPWRLVAGGVDTIATVTPDELDDLLALFRAHDAYRPVSSVSLGPAKIAIPDPFAPTHHREVSTLSPGDDYAARHDWHTILEPHDWTALYTGADGRTYWRRPGKREGISATTGGASDGVDRLYVFSSSAAPFDTETPYSKFAAYTTLEHGGDYSAAARALGAAGYGQQRDSYVEAATRITDDATRHMSNGSADGGAAVVPRRRTRLTPIDTIPLEIAEWLWQSRIPLGSLALVAGREGIGKSTVAYDLAAQLTRGVLPGRYYGQPRGVIVAASEDSYAHTIKPRLLAAGADTSRMWRVDVVTPEGQEVEISLPVDLDALEVDVIDNDVALILLDPLMSRLSATLDTHKDAEVRQALEPLVRLSERSGASVVGLIHVNKTVTNDPLTSIMGSRAFSAVARSVLFVMRHPDDDDLRLLGLVKCNVGPTNIPTLLFDIESAHVADIAAGAVWSSRIAWAGETNRSIADFMASHDEPEKTANLIDEAAKWLEGHLEANGPTLKHHLVEAAGILKFTEATLNKARRRIGVVSHILGKSGHSEWSLAYQSSETTQPDPFRSGLSRRGDMTNINVDEVGQNGQESVSVLSTLIRHVDPPARETP